MATNPINSSSSPEGVASAVNSVIRDIQGMQSVQIFNDDTGTRRVMLGRGSGGFYGLKVSQEGIDVYDASDSQLVFNSNNNVFKIVSSGTLNVPEMSTTLFSTNTYTASVQSQFVDHNLGYTPAVIGFITNSSQSVFLPMPYVNIASGGTGGGIGVYDWRLVVTNTQVYALGGATEYGGAFSGGTNANKEAKIIKYYLLQETAN